jgi:molecular chaperone DnaJ
MRTLIKNYYNIIGVSTQASPDEMKKAYKQTALKLHPDKDKGPGAEERFKVY